MLKEEKKAAIINELRQKYPLKDLLQLSGLARSTFLLLYTTSIKDKYKKEKTENLYIF